MWILLLNEYSPDIEYIKGEKNIVADASSRLPLNESQNNTQNSTHKKYIVPEINDIEEIPEGNFPIHLKLIKNIHGKNPA